MIFSRVDVLVPVGGVGIYDPRVSFRLPPGLTAEKLTFNAKDGDIVVQVREGDGAFESAVETTEQDGPRGFSSFVYVTPITGVRFRAKSVQTRVSFTLYG